MITYHLGEEDLTIFGEFNVTGAIDEPGGGIGRKEKRE